MTDWFRPGYKYGMTPVNNPLATIRAEIAKAIKASAARAGWSYTKVAAETHSAGKSAHYWFSGSSTPGGDRLLVLMRTLPGFAESLGFRAVEK